VDLYYFRQADILSVLIVRALCKRGSGIRSNGSARGMLAAKSVVQLAMARHRDASPSRRERAAPLLRKVIDGPQRKN
jgi:hypothetical protein